MTPPADVLATIAAYEDIEIAYTCASLLADPGLSVRLHVVLQTDDPALEYAVRATGAEVYRVSRADARGACWPRALGQLQHNGERYWAQFDSHSRFDTGWAQTLASQLESLPNKAALSSYALPYGPGVNPWSPDMVSDMKVHRWGDDGWHCAQVATPRSTLCPDNRPVPGRSWSAHLHFSRSSWIQEVPYDPAIWFSGEEQTTMVRAWTHGWDVWVPVVCPVYHRYHHESIRYRETVSQHKSDWWKYDVISKDRVARVYGWPRPPVHAHWAAEGVVLPPDSEGLGVYGIGGERSIDAFISWSGIDMGRLLYLPSDAWRRKLAGATEDWDALMTVGDGVLPGNQRGGPFARHVSNGEPKKAGATQQSPSVDDDVCAKLDAAICKDLLERIAESDQDDPLAFPAAKWPLLFRGFLEEVRGKLGKDTGRVHRILSPMLVTVPTGENVYELDERLGPCSTVIPLDDAARIIKPSKSEQATIAGGRGEAYTWCAESPVTFADRSVRCHAFVCGWKPG